MSQIALPLAWPDEMGPDGAGRDYLVSTSNAGVARHFAHWALWPVMATVLTGPRKSGRSLLGRLVARQSGGELADDAEARDEEALFHAWNRAQERRRPLVIVADRPPPAWSARLPDLRSRLLASPHVAIPDPDEALVALLIERRLLRRNLPAAPEVVRYLVPRIERSYLAVHRIVDALDALALERRQGLTVPLARRALERIGIADA